MSSPTITTNVTWKGEVKNNALSMENEHVETNTHVVREFSRRELELINTVRRLSNGSIVEAEVLATFSHELANYHSAQIQALASHFMTSLTVGLKSSQAQDLLQKYGTNMLPKSKELPMWVSFILSFTGGFSPLLWIAFVFVFITYIPFGTPPSNIYNLALAIAILIVIGLSGLFTFFQEVQSSLALSSFSKMIPPNCIVIRDGKSMSIPPVDLVVGDLVILETGMRVPSDMRLIKTNNLKIDKSMLTGENEPVKLFTEPVDSTIPLLSAQNIAFMGCNVVEGDGIGIVIATGKSNQLSKIADSVSGLNLRSTSLQREINRFVIFVGTAATITAVTCVLEWKFYLNVQHNGFLTLNNMIVNAISVLVAFIPEGLPLALQTGLTIIADRLCKTHKVLVKQLSIIETVGSMTMLASDKTGTLTQNKMSVSSILTCDNIIQPDGVSVLNTNFFASITHVAILCNQSTIDVNVDGKRISVGSNGIDRSLLTWADNMNLVEKVNQYNDLILRVPFSSATKISITVVGHDGSFAVLIKGAPEYVLERCTHYLDENTNEKKILTSEVSTRIFANITSVASTGKRVIALADYLLPSEIYGKDFKFTSDPTPNFPITGMTFLACIAVSDPPRPGVDEAIAELRGAGIMIAMVTGDAPNTAIAIAEQVGILSDKSAPIDNLKEFNESEKTLDIGNFDIESRKELPATNTIYDSLSKKETIQTVNFESFMKSTAIVVDGRDLDKVTPLGWNFIFSHSEMVFARTSPDQKLQIVKESQRRGHRVGVTGDGVNDSSAIKQADVGIAMGQSGSDVAKDAASIILLNDDFSAITKAVLEGRLIFTNLRRVIAYQIAAGCWSELIPVLATFFIGMPQPLSSFLMIIICCTTDVLAGIALMNEPPETALMQEKPRDLTISRLVNFKLIGYGYLWYGSLESVGSFINYFTYMADRGNTRAIPNPVPVDDDGNRQFPAGYRADQLMYAWNWEAGTIDHGLYNDEVAASSVASSVFFTTLVLCQMGHVFSIRRKTPYFSDAVMGTGDYAGIDGVWNRLWKKILSIRPIWRIIFAWSGAVIIANIFNEVPAVQNACGTGSVAGKYWGIAIGWSFAVFCIDQCRKWFILFYPNSIVGKLSWELSN